MEVVNLLLFLPLVLWIECRTLYFFKAGMAPLSQIPSPKPYYVYKQAII